MDRTLITCAAVLFFIAASPASAEKADRDKPTNIEASRFSLDDINKIQIFDGNVVLTQGTLVLRSDRLVVTQDADGFQKGVATGGENGLAYFKQKREAKDDYIEGKGERIEYNARDEQAEFFIRAWVKNGSDEVRGQYIFYDALTEKFLAKNVKKDEEKPVLVPGVPPPRVRAIIQPKEKKVAEPPPGDPTALKNSETVTPRQE